MAGWFRAILEPDQVVELRTVPPGGALLFRADRVEEMVSTALALTKMERCRGVYFTLNPLEPAMLEEAPPRYASDADVIRRRLLLVDVDAFRFGPDGKKLEGEDGKVSTTDAEKAKALVVILATREWLRSEGWPDPILVDSGNGYHLLYKIDLPAEDGGLVKRCLHALAARFGTDDVDVDTRVFNASRICKVPWTWARKGKSTKGRPHRLARVLEMPTSPDPVPVELLEAVAIEAASVAPDGLDLDDEIERKRARADAGRDGHARAAGVAGNLKAILDQYTDADLLQWAHNAKNGSRFSALYAGGDLGFKSPSEADCSLLVRLAYWTGEDAGRMGRLFDGSARGRRGKWAERPDYRELTIRKAIEKNGGRAADLSDTYLEADEGGKIRVERRPKPPPTRPRWGDTSADGGGPPTPGPFSLGLIDSKAFFSQVYTVDWLIDDVQVAGEAGVFGGPQKSLKTSILIDQAISLGTATPFLGRFAVRRKVRAALISGESGRRIIQANARQVCLARGIEDPGEADVLWGFALPNLTSGEHLEVLRKTIGDHGIEWIAIDPFYLTIMAGASGIDPKSMFEMGPLLVDVARVCLESGCTPQIAHHFVKNREDPFSPPKMTDLAYAGIGQFMRQWQLVAPRQPFDAEVGKFYLHFMYGGSAGHCGEFAVDIEVGKLTRDFDGRKWVVTIASPSEDRTAKQEEAKVVREARDAEKATLADLKAEQSLLANVGKVVEAIRSLAAMEKPATKEAIKDASNLNGEKTGAAVFRALRDGRIETYPATVANRGTGRAVEAYRMVVATGPNRNGRTPR